MSECFDMALKVVKNLGLDETAVHDGFRGSMQTWYSCRSPVPALAGSPFLYYGVYDDALAVNQQLMCVCAACSVALPDGGTAAHAVSTLVSYSAPSEILEARAVSLQQAIALLGAALCAYTRPQVNTDDAYNGFLPHGGTCANTALLVSKAVPALYPTAASREFLRHSGWPYCPARAGANEPLQGPPPSLGAAFAPAAIAALDTTQQAPLPPAPLFSGMGESNNGLLMPRSKPEFRQQADVTQVGGGGGGSNNIDDDDNDGWVPPPLERRSKPSAAT